MERRCEPVGVTNDGVLFVSCSGSSYLSLHAHQGRSGTKHPKSIWDRSRPDECHIFCVAEASGWIDKETGRLWSVCGRGIPPYGTLGERLAVFYPPSFPAGPWHGFPVGGLNGRKQHGRPPDEVAQNWKELGIINFSMYSRITKGRI